MKITRFVSNRVRIWTQKVWFNLSSLDEEIIFLVNLHLCCVWRMTFGIAYFCWIIFFLHWLVHDMRMRNTKGETVVISPFSSSFASSSCSDCLARCLAFYTCLDRGSAFLWHLINTYPVLSHVRCWGHSENPVFHVSASSFLHMSFHHLSTPSTSRCWKLAQRS